MNYQDSSVRFDIIVEGTALKATFRGTSTLPGTDAFIQAIEGQIAEHGSGTVRILMDLRGLEHIPMRVHMKMSAWLLRIKHQLAQVVVLGGGRAAKALVKGARMSNVTFCESEEAALKQWRD